MQVVTNGRVRELELKLHMYSAETANWLYYHCIAPHSRVSSSSLLAQPGNFTIFAPSHFNRLRSVQGRAAQDNATICTIATIGLFLSGRTTYRFVLMLPFNAIAIAIASLSPSPSPSPSPEPKCTRTPYLSPWPNVSHHRARLGTRFKIC